jgi:hypothetical protein
VADTELVSNIVGDLLASPVLILDSKTVPGRLVLLGEVCAKNKPVMMALELTPTTRSEKTSYMDVIKIASAYARSNVQNMINTSTIRFVDQNESRVDNWLKVNRLHLPLPNSQLVSANNSIQQNSEKSTENTKKVSDERSSKQKVYPKKYASVIIDEVVSEHLIFDDVYGEMKGKTKKEAASILWKALNTAEPGVKISAMVDEDEKEKAVEDGVRASKQRIHSEENHENGDVYTRGRSEGTHAGNGSARAGTENRKEQGIRYIQGDRQGRGRESSSLSDSEGRGITPEIFGKIRGTSVLDENGR